MSMKNRQACWFKSNKVLQIQHSKLSLQIHLLRDYFRILSRAPRATAVTALPWQKKFSATFQRALKTWMRIRKKQRRSKKPNFRREVVRIQLWKAVSSSKTNRQSTSCFNPCLKKINSFCATWTSIALTKLDAECCNRRFSWMRRAVRKLTIRHSLSVLFTTFSLSWMMWWSTSSATTSAKKSLRLLTSLFCLQLSIKCSNALLIFHSVSTVQELFNLWLKNLHLMW